MAGTESWMRTEMGGTSRASLITKPEVMVALLKREKRSLVIVGHEVTGAGPEREAMIGFIDTVIRIRQGAVLGTSYTVRDLISQGIRVDAVLGSMEIVDRLCDPSWKGLDGQGSYGLVLLAGFPYSLGWIMLSGLRSAQGLKTVSLDRRYQPHASWSFGNLTTPAWIEQLEAIMSLLEKG